MYFPHLLTAGTSFLKGQIWSDQILKILISPSYSEIMLGYFSLEVQPGFIIVCVAITVVAREDILGTT